MSNAVTAINGASTKGIITVSDPGLTGMITLRGNLSSPKIAAAVKSVTGTKMPTQRGVVMGKKGAVAWMSPDELFLLCDYAEADAMVAKLDKALKGTHSMAVNVSDARQVFHLAGKGIRNVLAKGVPADMRPASLPKGEMRRTRLGQLPVALWLTSEEEAYLICFRSVGNYIAQWFETTTAKEAEIKFF